MIQTLGRWRSSVYLRYIRTPTSILAATSGRLLHCNTLTPAQARVGPCILTQYAQLFTT